MSSIRVSFAVSTTSGTDSEYAANADYDPREPCAFSLHNSRPGFKIVRLG
jgi:hypothetical protein